MAVSSPTAIGLEWEDGAYDGNTPTLDYRVSHYTGGEWVLLASGLTAKSFLATELTSGVTYEFRIEARNIVGFSNPSTSIFVIAATPPETPAAPTTSITNNDLTIDWDAPTDNGSPIIGYRISVQDSTGTYVPICDGTDATLVAESKCVITV